MDKGEERIQSSKSSNLSKEEVKSSQSKSKSSSQGSEQIKDDNDKKEDKDATDE